MVSKKSGYLQIMHFKKGFFHCKPTSYWGSTMNLDLRCSCQPIEPFGQAPPGAGWWGMRQIKHGEFPWSKQQKMRKTYESQCFPLDNLSTTAGILQIYANSPDGNSLWNMKHRYTERVRASLPRNESITPEKRKPLVIQAGNGTCPTDRWCSLIIWAINMWISL